MVRMTARHRFLIATASIAVAMGHAGAARAVNPQPVAAKPGIQAKPAAPAPAPASAPAAAAPAPAAPAAAGPAPLAYEIDSPAQVIDQLYGDVCIPNFEAPDKIRAYALDRHLLQLTNPQLLPLYIGRGAGAAWVVPSPLGSFVLSIREEALRCAVWALQADPLAVDSYFRARVEGFVKPGFQAFKDRDTLVPTPVGNVRAVVFYVTEPDASESVEMTMLSAEKPGGAFQATYQIAKQGKWTPRPGQAAPPTTE
jgi:hypothetical protein